MKVAPVVAAALVFFMLLTESIQKKGKKPKFCMGEDGNRYKKGERYEDKEACTSFTCIKQGNKMKMNEKNNQCTGNFLESIKKGGKISGSDCYNLAEETSIDSPLTGCPASIPITLDGKILAGRVYFSVGNDVPELSCNGDCAYAFAETKFTETGKWYLEFGSAIINPGCTLILFQHVNYTGDHKAYPGPLLISNPKTEGPVTKCTTGPCIGSMLWTCKQTYPTCVPSDGWHDVTELNNAESDIPTSFSYKKTIGTKFSHSMKKSMSISETVSVAISAKFWGITASMKSTTGFKWSTVTTDTETTSEEQSYTVEVEVPAGKTVKIEEAMGTCGGSKIYTQMFRVIDSLSGKMVAKYQGKLTNYKIRDYE